MLLHDGGRIASTSIPYTSVFSMGLTSEHMETVIDVPRSLAGVEVAFAVRQPDKENVFRVSMRSTGSLDVSAVCAMFGGGGHKGAAGASLDMTLEEASRAVTEALLEMM